jgi:hypothetical protein
VLPENTNGGGSSNNNTSVVSGSGGSGVLITTNGAGGADTSTTGEGGSGAGECGGQSVNADPIQVNLLLVIDRSGSMADEADGFDDDKWTSMVESLNTALDGIDGEVSVGLQFFPDHSGDDQSACAVPSGSSVAVPIASGSEAITAVKDALIDEANAPSGATPTAAALQVAYSYFTEGAGADLEGNNYVLLALDGGPNCDTSLTCDIDTCTTNISVFPDATDNRCEFDPGACLDASGPEAQVKALADASVTTFVVGIPGSDEEAYESVLDALALAGGAPASATSPSFYQVQDATALSETLVSLTTDLVNSCELVLASPPPDASKVNVFVNDEVIPRLEEDGWDYDDVADPKAIIITGDVCAQIESEGVESVRVEYGCKTFEIPR